MTFFPLQLAMQQYVTIANCSGMYGACDASNLQKNAIQLQGNINVALDTISSAISTAVSNRSAAVNPNLGSVKCGGPTGTGAANLQWCSWNMVDTWAAAPFTYAQQNAVVAPANLQYTTPQQYPAEYESMVAATLEAQLQAFTATSALWQLMDTSQNWTVANTTAMAPIGPFGMWAISNAQVVQAVQQQLQNPATAYSQTPGPGFPVSQSMLSTITLFEYDTTYSGVSTDQWQVSSHMNVADTGPHAELHAVLKHKDITTWPSRQHVRIRACAYQGIFTATCCRPTCSALAPTGNVTCLSG